MSKFVRLLLLLFLFISLITKAQHKEFGLILGTTNYQGEVATTNEPDALFNDVRPNIGFFYRWYVNKHVHLRTDLSYALLHSEDQFHSNPDRGLRFNTNILEFNFQFEYNLLPYYRVYAHEFAPYVLAGLSAYSYDPVISPEFETIPDYLEVVENSGTGIAFFVGGGFKYKVTPRINVGLEASYRVTTKDDLDGYINTFSSVNDYYYHINVTISKSLF